MFLGGYDSEFSASTAKTELLDLDDKTKWTFGPTLYKPLSGLATVKSANSIFALGGNINHDLFNDEIYELICNETECNWETLPQKLAVARSGFVAMLIPDELAECWNTKLSETRCTAKNIILKELCIVKR